MRHLLVSHVIRGGFSIRSFHSGRAIFTLAKIEIWGKREKWKRAPYSPEPTQRTKEVKTPDVDPQIVTNRNWYPNDVGANRTPKPWTKMAKYLSAKNSNNKIFRTYSKTYKTKEFHLTERIKKEQRTQSTLQSLLL